LIRPSGGGCENFHAALDRFDASDGPAGSGKTTTIYACLRELATTGGRHVITVEDPVERMSPHHANRSERGRGLTVCPTSRVIAPADPEVLWWGRFAMKETSSASAARGVDRPSGHSDPARCFLPEESWIQSCVLCPERSAVARRGGIPAEPAPARALRLLPGALPPVPSNRLSRPVPAAEAFQFSDAQRAAFPQQGAAWSARPTGQAAQRWSATG